MLKIRLRRMGKRHRPFYRVVVSDSRDVPTAPAVEELGHYDPVQNPPEIRMDVDRIHHWVGQGAQMSATVKKLVKGYTPPVEETAEAAAPVTEKKAATPKKKVEKAEKVETAEKAEKVETAEKAEKVETAEKAEAKPEEAAPEAAEAPAEEAAADEATTDEATEAAEKES